MFGQGVDQSNPGNVCTAASGDTCGPGTQDSAPGAFNTPTFVAVDGSSGPSAGDVYVADTGDNLVSKFAPDGSLIGSWSTAGQLGGFGPLAGIAVDTSGDLWVYDHNENMFEYAQDGSFTTSWNSNRGVRSVGIAVDSVGNLYVGNGAPNLTIFTSSGSEIGDIHAATNPTGLALDPSSNDLYVDNAGGVIDRYDSSCLPNCAAPSDSFGSGQLSGALGLALDSSNDVYVADAGNQRVAVFAAFADITGARTDGASSLTPTAATVGGTVNPGAIALTDCHFDYGTDDSYGHSAPCAETPAEIGSGSDEVPVHADLSGLIPDTTYHYRLAASNANGQNQGSDRTFVTASPLPAIDQEPLAAIGQSTATLSAQINPNGDDTSCQIEYGTDDSYGGGAPCQPADLGSATSDQPASVDLSGLVPNTTYHYRFLATNSYGTTEGPDQAFLTIPPDPPDAATAPASAIAQTVATIAATVNGQGADTHYRFEYGTGPSYGQSTADTDAGPTSSDTSVHADLTGLQPSTTYHYRIVADNATDSAGNPLPGQSTFGADGSFITLPPAPLVSTNVALNITSTTATAIGSVDPRGDDTTYHLKYGPTANYGQSTAVADLGSTSPGSRRLSVALTGLTPDTIYHYRFLATNEGGTTDGEDQTLTTYGVAPATATGAATDIGSSTAKLHGELNPRSSDASYRFEYGTTANYGAITPETDAGSGDTVKDISADLSGLSPSTTYHYRIVATSDGGTANGEDRTFTTGAAPPVGGGGGGGNQPPLTCKKGFVKRHGHCVKKPRHKQHHVRSHRTRAGHANRGGVK